MSVSFTKESEDLFVVTVEGVLIFNELEDIQSKISTQIDHSRKSKVLVLAENFSGWAKEGDWGDLEFLHEHDPYIEKIAVVTGEKWKDWLLTFLVAGMRQATVESFPEGGAKTARLWLEHGA
jgi:hypothetical protein